jgi:O-succinylhomoserine sulfhydrylase
MEHLRRIVPTASSVVLTPNGLSACLSAVKAVIPTGGTLVYDKYIYYEVERGLMEIAAARGWALHALDFTHIPSLAEALHGLVLVNALFCDNPRNWWLDSLDTQAIAQLANAHGARLIVDTSVQPLQDPLRTGGDFCVISLSKYPSLGLTLGGAVLARDADTGALVSMAAESVGHHLGQEAATTILMQIVSLRDRLDSLSRKAEDLAYRLRNLSCIRHVRLPNASLCGGFSGGQISFHLQLPEQGRLLEKIISHNSLSAWHSLHLACTFGACITTVEHFQSNPRKREGLPVEVTNENFLPADLVRLGLGCEPLEDIWSDLHFALETSSNLLISARE